jgi:hypothetical protein
LSKIARDDVRVSGGFVASSGFALSPVWSGATVRDVATLSWPVDGASGPLADPESQYRLER